MTLQPHIASILRHARGQSLSPWFLSELEHAIDCGVFRDIAMLVAVKNRIVTNLAAHAKAIARRNVVIGMSGGLDSAVTAALFREAGWNVSAMLLPIHQDVAETERAREVCYALGIESQEVDLTAEYDLLAKRLNPEGYEQPNDFFMARVRLGNIRARLRMITLYDQAQALNGVVASTDNLSELTAGFWTLHGDVGDIAPIQSLNKSWEVPTIAESLNIPESVVFANPTDGLGIAGGDEEQLGCSYLEWDIILSRVMAAVENANSRSEPFQLDKFLAQLEKDAEPSDSQKIYRIVGRIANNAYKHLNPHNYNGLGHGDLDTVATLTRLFNPAGQIGQTVRP